MHTEPKARFEEVAQHLRLQVQRGALVPGDRMPSFPQMKAQGVSQHTMEKAYALLERDGLIQRESGRGVFVRQPEKARTGVLGLYGLVSNHSQHPYGAEVVLGIREAAHEKGYDVLLVRGYDAERLAKVDGVLTMTPNWGLLKEQLPASLSWVSLLWEVPGTPSVLAEETGGQLALVRHLLHVGHRRIAYLHVEWRDGNRVAVYQKACEEFGVTPEAQWLRPLYPEGFQRDLGFVGHGYQAMKDWLQEGFGNLGCTALMVHNDDAAVGVLRALREAGISVPGELAVTGFDGTEIAANAVPPLTTVRVPLKEIGAAGVTALCSLLQGQQVAAVTQVPASLVLAGSTGAA